MAQREDDSGRQEQQRGDRRGRRRALCAGDVSADGAVEQDSEGPQPGAPDGEQDERGDVPAYRDPGRSGMPTAERYRRTVDRLTGSTG
ncbi:hypothetical protein [Streptomyces griseus]|uniref:hypothetical protein n=1 Tax=Streptomyces griseus TaxID=1911 RepID=UPI00131B7067|nr:hypothetical protein [Streptomyces griseus]